MRTLTTTILFLATALLAAAGPDDLLLVPGTLDLGANDPSAVVKRSVWVVNTGPRTVRLTKATGSCGCTAVDFTPTDLPPHGAVEVPLRVTAPRTTGTSKTVHVTITADGRPPLKLAVRVATTGPPAATGTVQADPGEVDIGSVQAGAVVSASAHLLNTASATRTVSAVRPGCACMKVVDFQALAIPPGEAGDVHLDVTVPSDTAGDVLREVTIVVEGQRALTVPVRMTVRNPLLDRVREHLARTLASRFAYDDFELDGDTVTAIAWSDDGARPLGRVVCTLAAGGRPSGTLFEAFTPSSQGEGPGGGVPGRPQPTY